MLPSISCVKAEKIPQCSPLPGEFGVDKGSARVTVTEDVRTMLSIGDTVKLGDVAFDVVGPMDEYTFGLNKKWNRAALAHIHATKCLKSTEGGKVLCGAVQVFQDSRVVKTSCDLTADISASDTVRIGGESFTVINPMDDCTLTLNRPYPDETAGGLKIVRLPVSEQQRVLEELARKKLLCLSIYCLAKIEEQERDIAFSLPRALTVLNPEGWHVGDHEEESAEEMSSTVGHPNDATADGAEGDPVANRAARDAQAAMVMKQVNRTRAAVRLCELRITAAKGDAEVNVAREACTLARTAFSAATKAAAAIFNGDRGSTSAGSTYVSATEASRDAENSVKQAKMSAITAHMALQNALASGSPAAIRKARRDYGEAASAAAGAMSDMAVTNGQVALTAAKEGGDSSVIGNAAAALAAAKAMSKATTARNAANALLASGHAAGAARLAQDAAAAAAAAAYAAAQGEKTAAEYRGAEARRGADANKMKAAEEAAKSAHLKVKSAEAAKKAAEAKAAYAEALGAPETDQKKAKIKAAAVNADLADQRADDAQGAASPANNPLTDDEINEWRGLPPSEPKEVDESLETINPDGEVVTPSTTAKPDGPPAGAPYGPGGAFGPGGPGGDGGPGGPGTCHRVAQCQAVV